MYIVSAYPIALLPQKYGEPLSYFSKDPAGRNALIRVLIQRKQVYALVENTEPAQNKKMFLRRNDYALKKIQSVVADPPLFHPLIVDVARKLSKTYFEPVGSIFKVYVATSVLEGVRQFHRKPAVSDPFRDKLSEVVIGTFEVRNKNIEEGDSLVIEIKEVKKKEKKKKWKQ